MALLQINLFSQSLMRTVTVNVILPADKRTAPGEPQRPDVPYKTLYLLHGVLGNYTDWVIGTRLARYAEEHDLCVVMPSGDNAFYVDQPASRNYYGEFVGKELVELTRKMLPLSHKREDTYIGGLSMGGYGAIRNGLKYHETFGAIIGLSAALFIEKLKDRTNKSSHFLSRRDYAEAVFGDLSQVESSDRSPRYLIKKLLAEGAAVPDIYLACGDQDSLLSDNQDFVAFLKENQVKVTFEVGPGGHEWDFWDTYIKKGIEWLPLEQSGLGISSGNVEGIGEKKLD